MQLAKAVGAARCHTCRTQLRRSIIADLVRSSLFALANLNCVVPKLGAESVAGEGLIATAFADELHRQRFAVMQADQRLHTGRHACWQLQHHKEDLDIVYAGHTDHIVHKRQAKPILRLC